MRLGDGEVAPVVPYHPHACLGRVRTNAVQLPRAQDESKRALISIGPWESSRDDEKGHVTAGMWSFHPLSHLGPTTDLSISIPIPRSPLVTCTKRGTELEAELL